MAIPCDKTPELSIHEFKRWKCQEKNFVLLDVRSKEEYDQGNIKGVNLPLDQLPGRLSELDKQQTYVVHCQLGPRGRKAVAMLQESGFTMVHHLTGGYAGWCESE
jgi:rhodanese-related sulfurtransferase